MWFLLGTGCKVPPKCLDLIVPELETVEESCDSDADSNGYSQEQNTELIENRALRARLG